MKIEKLNFPEPGLLILSRGVISGTKKPYWAYVMVPAENLEAYSIAQQKGGMDLQEFGDIICWDEGEEPSKDIRKQMAELYGANEDFVEEFMKNLRKSKVGRDFIAEIENVCKKIASNNSN